MTAMALFALPLPKTASAPQTRAHFSYTLPVRKRKREESPNPSDDEEKSIQDVDLEEDNSDYGLQDELSNPLSLNPKEIAQYRLAGLRLNETLPSGHRWPHRGPKDNPISPAPRATRTINAKSATPDNPIQPSIPKLRTQHLGVLTAILHKCLQELDIPRATRAWAMLLRTEMGGHGVDIRSSGYWAVGAGLLAQSLDDPVRRRGWRGRGDSDASLREGEEEDVDERRRARWGTPQGLERAKEYYERLILQYPYKRQYHDTSVTALDFWPEMVAMEIYGIWSEYRSALEALARKQSGSDLDSDSQDDGNSSDDHSSSQNSSNPSSEDPDDLETTAAQKRSQRRRRKRVEQHYKTREEIRTTALSASTTLATRLDNLMTTPPYSDSAVMQRARGMLALWIGDLSVPVSSEIDNEGGEEGRKLRSGRGESERRLGRRQRMLDVERGRERRREERERATKCFERAGMGGEEVERLVGLDEDEEGDEES